MIPDRVDLFSIPIFTLDLGINSVALKHKIETEYDNDEKGALLPTRWQSRPTLMTDCDMSEFVALVIKIAENINGEMGWANNTYEITSLWANIFHKGEAHKMHNHANNIFSFVYYVNTCPGDSIKFVNPNIAANVFQPVINESNQYNSQLIEVSVHNDLILFFPSYLFHFVDVIEKSSRRLSLAGNLIVRGELDHKNSLQHLRL